MQKIKTMRRRRKKHRPPGDNDYSGTGKVWVKIYRDVERIVSEVKRVPGGRCKNEHDCR